MVSALRYFKWINPGYIIWTLSNLFLLHERYIKYLSLFSAIPFLCILASIPWFLPYETISIPYLPTFHVIASLAPWVGSIVYHLFMNHEKGYSVYEAILTIDLLGIWTTQTTGRWERETLLVLYLFSRSTLSNRHTTLMDIERCCNVVYVYKMLDTILEKPIYWALKRNISFVVVVSFGRFSYAFLFDVFFVLFLIMRRWFDNDLCHNLLFWQWASGATTNSLWISFFVLFVQGNWRKTFDIDLLRFYI